jgi:diguanylate cyclase (GGDEF)-like protein/PAS domain S-box-containing protein
VNKKRALPSISSKLTVWFTVFALGMTLVTAVLVEDAATTALQARIGTSLGDLARHTTRELDRSLLGRYNDIRLLAAQPAIIDSGAPLAVRQRALEQVQSIYQHFAWLCITDARGKVVAATDGILAGVDVSGRSWWGNAQKGKHLGDVHEALLLARKLPSRSGEPWRFFDIAFPYYDAAGRFGGVVGAHLSWEWAHEIDEAVLEPNKDQGHIDSLIVRSDGVVLLGPEVLLGKVLASASFQEARTGKSGFRVERWPDGKDYVVGFSSSGAVMNEPGLGWSVLVRQDVAEAFAPVEDIRRRVLWSGLPFALVASLIGWLNARRITRPLARLAESARAVRLGREQVILPAILRYREIGDMTKSMESMVENIQKQRADLLVLNLTLESRVRDRTEALALSESRLRTIADSMPALIAYADRDLRYQFCNRIYQDWFGKSSADVIGHTIEEVLGPERFALIADRLKLALMGETVEFEQSRPNEDGAQFIKVTYIPERDANGGVTGIYIMAQDISEMKHIQLNLERDVLHDTLTGLPNRQALMLELNQIGKRARRHQNSYAILFLDVDRFKVINDNLGHGAGDQALIAFAQRLQGAVRESDLVARLSGDEFVVVVSDMESADDGATAVAEKILAALRDPMVIHDMPIVLSTSIGIAVPRHSGEPAADILRRADEAMYEAKAAGRNTIRMSAVVRLPLTMAVLTDET